MIHYYTYYSVGGYKDMYLGSEGCDAGRAYYLPLLPVEKKQAENEHDTELLAKVERQQQLPKIGVLSQEDNFGLPSTANTLVTHGSYSFAYTYLEDDKHIMVIRGLSAKDTVPFLFSLMSDSREDLPRMNRLATYIVANPTTSRKELAACLHYDPLENGLCVELAQLNAWVKRVASDRANDRFSLVNGQTVHIKARQGKMALLLVPDGVKVSYALGELAMSVALGPAFCELLVLPKDDPAEARRHQDWWAEEEHRRKVRQRIIIAVGASLAFLFIGGMIMISTRYSTSKFDGRK